MEAVSFIREQIGERYLSGDFEGASDLCYQQLCKISEPLDEPSFAHYKPLLRHQCSNSYCACEHLLSLSAQFMFELHYAPEYIVSFLTHFYYQSSHLPFVCVGILARMNIHQSKYDEAKKILEDCLQEAKYSTIKWTPADKEKYCLLLSILVLHVLIPQRNFTLAIEYLEDSHHPAAVLPLGELKEELTRKIKSFAEDEDNRQNPNNIHTNKSGSLFSTLKPHSSNEKFNKSNNKYPEKSLVRASTSSTLAQRMKTFLGIISSQKNRVRVLLYTLVVVLVCYALVSLRKRVKPLAKIVEGTTELLTSAFSVNNGVRRQRQIMQRNGATNQLSSLQQS